MGFTAPFTSRIESQNGVARIALSGELDLASAPVLNDQLEGVEAQGVSGIMLDLRNLTFLDGEGLRTFLSARARSKANGHRLILVGSPAPARRLFELTSTQFLIEDQEITAMLDQFTGGIDAAPTYAAGAGTGA